MLVESSICRFNHVSVVNLDCNFLYLLKLDLGTTTSTTLKFFRAQMNAFSIITVTIINITM